MPRHLGIACLILAAPFVLAEEGPVYLVAAGQPPRPAVPAGILPQKDTLSYTLTTGGIKVQITYEDPEGWGFRDLVFGAYRRDALEDALAYVCTALHQSGELELHVNLSEVDGTGLLAWCGTYFDASSPGFQRGAASERLLTGEKPSFLGSLPEILLEVDFGFGFYTGSSDTPPDYLYDLRSVLIHEITHGLGFVSLIGADGNSVLANRDGFSSGVYALFDAFVLRSDTGEKLIAGDPPVFLGAAYDLTSPGLAFSGPETYTRYGQDHYPALYTPETFANGESIQHWDPEDEDQAGIMQPAYARGTSSRAYAETDLGVLVDLGYLYAEQPATADPGTVEGQEEGEGETSSEGEGIEGEGEIDWPFEGEPDIIEVVNYVLDCAEDLERTQTTEKHTAGGQALLGLSLLALAWLGIRQRPRR